MNLKHLLRSFDTHKALELQLVPDFEPVYITAEGKKNSSNLILNGAMINLMVFPLIPDEQKRQLPNQSSIEFDHSGESGNFRFLINKSPAGLSVTITRKNNASTAAPEIKSQHSPTVRIENSAAPNLSAQFAVQQKSDNAFAPRVKFPASELKNAAPSTNSAYENIFQEFEALPETTETLVKNARELTPPATTSRTVFTEAVQPTFEVDIGAKNEMERMFRRMVEINASDLHISVSMPPMVRRDGKMATLEDGAEPLSAEIVRDLLHSLMPPRNREEFNARRDTDFVIEINELARFRANIFMDRKGMGGVFRLIPTKIYTAKQLRLSPAILDLCNLSNGLVIVTGPTGCGKSTTLSAMVDYINNSRAAHIITIEDPIEFVHENQKCLINQREVYTHTDSYNDALRAALREDPDVLLIGEMRDLETMSIAIETAETGHLVLATLHTTTPAATIDRMIDQFPPDRQQQIRVILSECLRGVIAQTLVPKKGGGRVAAFETLIVTPAISNLIREGKTFQMASTMQTGKQHGMVLLNEALLELVKNNVVEPREAYQKSMDKTGFETGLKRLGLSL